MRLLRKTGRRIRLLFRARRNRRDLLVWLIRRPAVGVAVMGHEVALLTSNRLPSRLQALATLRVAALVGCEFCLDIGSAVGMLDGLNSDEVVAVGRSGRETFGGVDELVIRLADAMTATPPAIDDSLREALLVNLSKTQYMELAATIAWENHRARLNRSLGIRPAGFSDGAACALAVQAR